VIERITASNGAIHTTDGVGPVAFPHQQRFGACGAPSRQLDAETSNGPIELVDLEGDAQLRTSNGHVDVRELRGSLDATTSNSGDHGGDRPLLERACAPPPTMARSISNCLRISRAGFAPTPPTARLRSTWPSSTNAQVIASTNNRLHQLGNSK